ncbi:hypothetical protein QTP70_010908 [Hemibagrus guttatus]|uniref:Reverse transcriptase domain-containing protein n=1 Tax=Hemibagrus guttatus TaxID=175788 RepID=A0AAE0QMP3_9TELE|nr:hypothetical protein QTP70_010908 [Hemibagrus guttatus]
MSLDCGRKPEHPEETHQVPSLPSSSPRLGSVVDISEMPTSEKDPTSGSQSHENSQCENDTVATTKNSNKCQDAVHIVDSTSSISVDQSEVQELESSSEETTFDLSTVPVVEYTLQDLEDLVKSLEVKAAERDKSMVTDVVKCILDLFHNGDKQNLANLAALKGVFKTLSNLCVKEKHAVVLQYQLPKHVKMLENCSQILMNETTLPSEDFKSSWLNVNGQPADVDNVLAEPISDCKITWCKKVSQPVSESVMNVVDSLAQTGTDNPEDLCVNAHKDIPKTTTDMVKDNMRAFTGPSLTCSSNERVTNNSDEKADDSDSTDSSNDLPEIILFSPEEARKIFADCSEHDQKREPHQTCQEERKDLVTLDHFKYTCSHMNGLGSDSDFFCPSCWNKTPILYIDQDESLLTPREGELNTDYQRQSHSPQSGKPNEFPSAPVCLESSIINSVTSAQKSDVMRDPNPASCTLSSLLDHDSFSSFALDSATDTLLSSLSSTMDLLCPLSTIRRKNSSTAPCLSDVLCNNRRELRSAARKWKKSKIHTDLISYRTLLSKFSLDVTSAKTSFYKEKLETSAQDPRKLHNIFSSLLNPPAPPSPSSLTAEDFATFYTEKIERICQTFTSPPTSSTSHSQHSATPSLTQLSTVAAEEVLQITGSCNPTTCPLDPIPSAMLQTISPDLLPFITTVINGSLTSGHVPTVFKKARVIPILKKPALDPSDISNYRPNNLHDPNQSGFKAAHSTETALLAVTEKLHAARSAQLSSVLILLDLSAAFDTVNHKTLLSTLRSFGICGTAWEWFASYLDGRSYQLKLNPSKTELLIIPGDPSPAQDLAISQNNSMISPSATARNLGVTMDNQLSFSSHVTNVTRSCLFLLYNIRRIRPFLSTQATQVLVQSLVISRLDYCSSLLAGLPLNAIRPLQMIQNAAAPLVFNLPKFSHTTPLLRSLHWLPVAARIRFKTLMLAYKAKNGPAPSYLKALVTPRTAPRSLRSTSTARLVPPSLREKGHAPYLILILKLTPSYIISY